MHVAKKIDEVLAARAEVGRPAKRKWRGSLLGGCVRSHWYSANGVSPTEPFTPETLRIFAMGNAVGDFLTDALTEAYGDKIRFEVPVLDDEDDFSGNMDAVLELPDGAVAVLEFKSIKSAGFTRLTGPKPEHAIQAASYAWFHGKAHAESGGDVPEIEAWVVYVNKDTYEIKEFPLDLDYWIPRARRVLRVLNYYGDRKPPRLPDAGRRKWPCGFCNWRTECLGGAK